MWRVMLLDGENSPSLGWRTRGQESHPRVREAVDQRPQARDPSHTRACHVPTAKWAARAGIAAPDTGKREEWDMRVGEPSSSAPGYWDAVSEPWPRRVGWAACRSAQTP